MNILALECSVPHASLALDAEGVGIVSRAAWTAERNHDAWLFPALEAALDRLGERPLDLILVGAGPGSYGGVRVALAAGVGIAEVRGAKLVALDSWLQLAEGERCIVSDAKRGGWTLRRPDGHIEVLTLAQLQQEPGPLGSTEPAGTLNMASVAAEGLTPTAEGLIRSWRALSPERQAEIAAKPAEPIYVRPPHITAAKHKPWEIRK